MLSLVNSKLLSLKFVTVICILHHHSFDARTLQSSVKVKESVKNCRKHKIENILLFEEEFPERYKRKDSDVVGDTDGKYQPGSSRKSCYVTQLY